jgi:hypothetical protein
MADYSPHRCQRGGQHPLHSMGKSTLGTFVTTQDDDTNCLSYHLERPGHFCLAPHVAMRVGLYLHPQSALAGEGALRAVSEDPARTCSSVRARCFPWAFIP